MMTALDRQRKYVPESQSYFEKKRAKGKGRNQANRASERHLCRIIYKIQTKQKEYQLRPEKGKPKPGLDRDRALKRKRGAQNVGQELMNASQRYLKFSDEEEIRKTWLAQRRKGRQGSEK